eukprot:GHUV01018277.1.p2 GENE.GHUV01018277.1~~GHUV01018277.1.p2  ORF type:complete len:109 (+),score=19.09 GHUV01018277.1:210-536(+)
MPLSLLQEAPLVQHTGQRQAPPFCSGSAVCFASTTVEGGGLTYNLPDQAKKLASRISGTKWVQRLDYVLQQCAVDLIRPHSDCSRISGLEYMQSQDHHSNVPLESITL